MKPSSSGRGAYVPPHRRGEASRTSRPQKLEEDPDVDALCNTFSRVYCINLASRVDKWNMIQKRALNVGESFARKLERFDAIDGTNKQDDDDIVVRWDCTQNAKYSRRITSPGIRSMTHGEIGCALSHISIWRQLGEDPTIGGEDCSVLILEDDAIFATYRGQSRFAKAFATTMKKIPDHWDILYLGFSSRGERQYVNASPVSTTVHTKNKDILPRSVRWEDPLDPEIKLYRPTYGFHTHAYAITKRAAKTLVQHHIPIQGPIDVWLADNQWFQLAVYCAVIANEGWNLGHGNFEGEPLIIQDRGRRSRSDIEQSAEMEQNGHGR